MRRLAATSASKVADFEIRGSHPTRRRNPARKTNVLLMAPFYDGRLSRGVAWGACDGAAPLVGVNVVRPVGRCMLTPPARRRVGLAVPGPRVFREAARLGNVE